MKTKYKYLEFIEGSNPGRKTRVFDVYNHVTCVYLGWIGWDRGWRQYVSHTPHFGPFIFSAGCHLDFARFIKQLMDERKK